MAANMARRAMFAAIFTFLAITLDKVCYGSV